MRTKQSQTVSASPSLYFERYQKMDHMMFARARAAYKRGEDVTDFLKSELGETTNSPEIIEIAYDL